MDLLVLIILAGAFGLVIGSFLNVVIYRLPKQLMQSYLTECRALIAGKEVPTPEAKLTLASPASHCPHCKHPIRPWHNIPLISFIWLKGHCPNCHTAIAWHYPLVEAVSGIAAIGLAYHFGLTPIFLAALFLSYILITLTVIDIQHQLLPDQLIIPCLWVGLIFNAFFTGFVPYTESLLGAVIGYMSLWLIYWAFKLITGKEGMGYGDFKLFALIGAWFGWMVLPLVLLIASTLGAIVGITAILLKKRTRQEPIPFGPFLAFAAWVGWFLKDSIYQIERVIF